MTLNVADFMQPSDRARAVVEAAKTEAQRNSQALDTFSRNNNGSTDASGVAAQRRIFDEHSARAIARGQNQPDVGPSGRLRPGASFDAARDAAGFRRNDQAQADALGQLSAFVGHDVGRYGVSGSNAHAASGYGSSSNGVHAASGYARYDKSGGVQGAPAAPANSQDQAMQQLIQMLGGGGGSRQYNGGGGGGYGNNKSTGDPLSDLYEKNLTRISKQWEAENKGALKPSPFDNERAHTDAMIMAKRQYADLHGLPADDIAGTSSRADAGARPGAAGGDWRDQAQQQIYKILLDRVNGLDGSKPVGYGQAMFPFPGQGPSVLGQGGYRASPAGSVANLQPTLPSSNASVTPLPVPGAVPSAAVAPSFAQAGVVPGAQGPMLPSAHGQPSAYAQPGVALSATPDSQLPGIRGPLGFAAQQQKALDANFAANGDPSFGYKILPHLANIAKAPVVAAKETYDLLGRVSNYLGQNLRPDEASVARFAGETSAPGPVFGGAVSNALLGRQNDGSTAWGNVASAIFDAAKSAWYAPRTNPSPAPRAPASTPSASFGERGWGGGNNAPVNNAPVNNAPVNNASSSNSSSNSSSDPEKKKY